MIKRSSSNHLIMIGSHLLRRLTTFTVAEVEEVAKAKTTSVTGAFSSRTPDSFKRLYMRLSRIGGTGESVSDVLHRYTQEGNRFGRIDLLNCARSLRKFKRYGHCLEIYQWMDKRKFYFSNRDHALRINMICEADGHGITEAEKFFESLHTDSKDSYTYGALLDCYCKEKMEDKAVTLFEEMDKKGCVSTFSFLCLMKLSMTMDKPEKVPLLVEQMKERKITVDSYCYNILMRSYVSMNDLQSAGKTLEEIEQDKELRCHWSIYTNLASFYIESGHTEKAEVPLKKLEEHLKHPQTQDSHDISPYHYLITLYARIGNLDAVHRVWSALKSAFPITSKSSYLVMLPSLSRLGDLDGLLKCFDECNSQLESEKNIDKRLPSIVISACLRHNRVDEAESVFEDAVKKSRNSVFFSGHERFISHYLEKGETSSALARMWAAADEVGGFIKWKPAPEIVDKFFKRYMEEKDVDGAEELFAVLRILKCNSSRRYLSLLEIYKAAGKCATGIREKMTEDRIEITSDHEKLLGEVCP